MATDAGGRRRLLIGLNLLPWLAPRTVPAAAGLLGDLEAALRAGDRALEEAAGAPGRAAEVREALGGAEAEEERARRLGLRVVTTLDEGYPAPLRSIPDPPPVLYVRGGTEGLFDAAFAIVGSRRCSPYGRQVAFEFARALSAAGVTVVSGLARGVDGAAHRGALEGGGRTAAVLGCGLDVTYPPEHGALAASVAEKGAVLSEYPLRTPPLAWNFPRRNRVLSGLSRGVLVVEAAERSGSLVTAAAALEQGREVYALPGSVLSPTSLGTNRLLQDGAQTVLGVEDLLRQLGVRRAATGGTPAAPEDDADPVLARIGYDPVPLETVAAECGIPPARLMGRLLSLELRGAIRRLPGDWLQRLR